VEPQNARISDPSSDNAEEIKPTSKSDSVPPSSEKTKRIFTTHLTTSDAEETKHTSTMEVATLGSEEMRSTSATKLAALDSEETKPASTIDLKPLDSEGIVPLSTLPLSTLPLSTMEVATLDSEKTKPIPKKMLAPSCSGENNPVSSIIVAPLDAEETELRIKDSTPLAPEELETTVKKKTEDLDSEPVEAAAVKDLATSSHGEVKPVPVKDLAIRNEEISSPLSENSRNKRDGTKRSSTSGNASSPWSLWQIDETRSTGNDQQWFVYRAKKVSREVGLRSKTVSARSFSPVSSLHAPCRP
jgi:hypothetical protein